MFREIISERLPKLPPMVDCLASGGGLLAAWHWGNVVRADDGMGYQFFLYSPAHGWQGYRWDERYGDASRIHPISSGTVWVDTNRGYLMRISIGQDGKAEITARTKGQWVLRADENSCTILEDKSILRHLSFSKNGRIVSKVDVDIGLETFPFTLSDGAILAFDFESNDLFVISPEGKRLHEESGRNVYYECCSPPFILRAYIRGGGNYVYYSADPRQGWCRTSILKVHRARTGTCGVMIFLDILDDARYALVAHSNWDIITMYYASLEEGTERVTTLWDVKVTGGLEAVRYNGLICMATKSPIVGVGDALIPDNTGFLAWDPNENIFYADLPNAMAVHKVSMGRSPTIRIPEIWSKGMAYGKPIG